MKKATYSLSIGTAICALMVLSACTSTSSPFANRANRTLAQPEQLTPVQNSTVQQSSLPPVGSEQGQATASWDNIFREW